MKTITPSGWNITDITSIVTFGFTKPGSSNNGGTYAFLANFPAPDSSAEDPSAKFVLSQQLNTCAGKTYTISLDYRFDNAAQESCFLMFSAFSDDKVPKDTAGLKLTTSGDNDQVKPHAWLSLSAEYVATSPSDLLAIAGSCEGHVWNNWSIDNVAVTEQKA